MPCIWAHPVFICLYCVWSQCDMCALASYSQDVECGCACPNDLLTERIMTEFGEHDDEGE